MTELRTPDETAARLRCSRKTLSSYVRDGKLRYVIMGSGTKRPRKMFTDPDIDDFIERQTRRDVPCPSTSPRNRRTTSTISSGEIVAFSALRNARIAEKLKR
ncbi:helix-turn-helix domain-containing protein [Reyranella sp.]|uniref:helix-turn-helix domain-containing protein n=1 Tax=Reyranella sp. TaxID=1929291 RepID=UPI003782EE1E